MTSTATPQVPVITCTRAFAGLPSQSPRPAPGSPASCPAPLRPDDVALLTSELVTNAILHSASRLPGGQVTVSVQAADGMVRVDVTDQGELPPRFPRSRGLGQGLALVAALADVFGADGPDRWFAVRTGGAR